MLYSLVPTSASKRQEAPEALKPDIGTRDETSIAQGLDAEGARKVGELAPATLAAGEKSSEGWAEALSQLEKLLAEVELPSVREGAQARPNHEVPERSIVEHSPGRKQQPERALSHQEKATATKKGVGKTQTEALLSIQRWGQEAVRLSKELLRSERDLLASRESLSELEEQLRSELEAATAERNRFVSEETSLFEAIRHLSAALEAIYVPTTAGSATSPEDSPQRHPPPSSVLDTRTFTGPGLKQVVTSTGPVQVKKNEAFGRLKKAAQVARKADDDGKGTTEVLKILELAVASFKTGDFEDAVKHSEAALEILRGAPPEP